MTRRALRRWAVPVLLIAMIAAIAIDRIRDRLPTTGDFAVPSAAEARAAQARFSALLAAEPGASPPAGLALRRVEGRAGETVLREPGEDCRGRGIYRLRKEATLPLLIAAPHDGADRNTGAIAAHLFEEHPVAAAAWNSAPRRPSSTCPGGGDPTRVDTHYLTAFSLAFAEAHPAGRIVQLHGFAAPTRQSRAAQLADVIVSDGSGTPTRGLLDVADCLSVALAPMTVLVYPLETKELGATINRQGRALRAAGFGGFVHLEMSAALRTRLVEDRALRDGLGRCLATGVS